MKTPTLIGGAVALTAVALAGGFALGRLAPPAPASAAAPAERKVLYWYDPMVPSQHFDHPGKSPFMDMALQPKYAEEAQAASSAPAVQLDAAKTQALGLRLATVERGALPSDLIATGTVAFNDRDVAVVQAKAAGFVQKVYARAPGDVVAAGAPLADLLVPEWAGAQGEYLAMRRTGDASLVNAARQRLALLGVPPQVIAGVERSGQVGNIITIATPTGGMIKTLSVRNGMSVAAGQTLAEVNGLGEVWLNAALPEAVAGQVRLGQTVRATFAAYPGEAVSGRVTAILPEAQADTHTVTVRIELPNPGGRLRPGLFATVAFAGPAQPALLVPSEAVIRTGRRTLVMLAEAGGRYRPAEIQAGREAADKTEVLAGLTEGEKVVASGQFLLDSEASLSGLQARPIAAAQPAGMSAPPALAVYESRGRVETIDAASVTLSHEPVPALGWPAMTMTFRLAEPALAKGIKVGDRVAFGFDQPAAGPTVRRMGPARP